MKEVYKQLKELGLTHIFYWNYVWALIIGTSIIIPLVFLNLYIPIISVLFLMFCYPIVRMRTRMYLYTCRKTMEGSFDSEENDDNFVNATLFVNDTWKFAFEEINQKIRTAIAIVLFGVIVCVCYCLRVTEITVSSVWDLLFYCYIVLGTSAFAVLASGGYETRYDIEQANKELLNPENELTSYEYAASFYKEAIEYFCKGEVDEDTDDLQL